MVAVTYEVRVAATPRKSRWTRFIEALIESRMKQANRDLRLHLSSYSFDERSHRLVQTKPGDIPFGW